MYERIILQYCKIVIYNLGRIFHFYLPCHQAAVFYTQYNLQNEPTSTYVKA